MNMQLGPRKAPTCYSAAFEKRADADERRVSVTARQFASRWEKKTFSLKHKRYGSEGCKMAAGRARTHLLELIVRARRMWDSPLQAHISVHLVEVLPQLLKPHFRAPTVRITEIFLYKSMRAYCMSTQFCNAHIMLFESLME